MTILGLEAKDLRAVSSLGVIFGGKEALVLFFKISVVITLIYVSNVGDLPVGGVQPVGVRKLSVVYGAASLNQCCSLSRLLNSKVSRCTKRSLCFVGWGQNERPRLNSVVSSSDKV